MASEKLFFSLFALQVLFSTFLLTQTAAENSKLFREYIGANFVGVKFSDVPVHPNVTFHFILSFAIDYTTSSSSPKPTNGNFNVFWDTVNLTPSQVRAIRANHRNVKVAMSLGGDSVAGRFANFTPTSINSWVRNAIISITQIVKENNLDGIDIDYEHFSTDPNTFAECIGRLLFSLKQNKIVSFASIAPFDSNDVQPYYLALWKKYGHLIDFVNFQFYAYEKGTTVSQFLEHFEDQRSNYKGGKILVSFGTDGSGGLSPQNGFFKACGTLQSQGKMNGIFIWSADDSKKDNFRFEKESQNFLASIK